MQNYEHESEFITATKIDMALNMSKTVIDPVNKKVISEPVSAGF